jgi:hypothetical protein
LSVAAGLSVAAVCVAAEVFRDAAMIRPLPRTRG